MADTKITDLTAATNVDGTEPTVIVQSATTKKVNLSVIKTYMVGTVTVSQVSGSDFTTSSTSLVDITGLTYAAAANKLYRVEVDLFGQNTGTAGMKIALAFSAAGAAGWHLSMSHTTSAAASTAINPIGTASTTIYWTTATTDLTSKLIGTIATGANTGNITAQALKVTSGTLTVHIGSTMTVTQLT
jgi:hypothetical protein